MINKISDIVVVYNDQEVREFSALDIRAREHRDHIMVEFTEKITIGAEKLLQNKEGVLVSSDYQDYKLILYVKGKE